MSHKTATCYFASQSTESTAGLTTMNASTPAPYPSSDPANSLSPSGCSGSPRIIHAASVEPCSTPPGQMRVLLNRYITGSLLGLIEVRSSIGQGQAPHNNVDEDRVLMVRSGCFEVCIGDAIFEVGAG